MEPGWHRNAERAARGIRPVASPSIQLETWERQLCLFEIMLLSGTVHPCHKELAHAWGRDKGFHNALVAQVSERRGELERKKRSDSGRPFSTEQKEAFKSKINMTRKLKQEQAQAAALAAANAAADTMAQATSEDPPAIAPASIEEMVVTQEEEDAAQALATGGVVMGAPLEPSNIPHNPIDNNTVSV